jgi:hypothetical protein
MQMVPSFFVGPLGTLSFAWSNRSGVAMKASLGKSVARKYPSIVS